MSVLLLLALVASPLHTLAWTDWDKRQTCTPSEGVHQPNSVDQVVPTVQAAYFTNSQLKVVGSGHSFSPITLTDDGRQNGSIMLNLDHLNAVLQLPTPTNLSVIVEAGIRVHDLNAALLQAGYALRNTGAIAIQSIAGATQT